MAVYAWYSCHVLEPRVAAITRNKKPTTCNMSRRMTRPKLENIALPPANSPDIMFLLRFDVSKRTAVPSDDPAEPIDVVVLFPVNGSATP